MLVVSVGALATLSIYRLVEVAIRSNASLDGVLALARTLRVSPLITDVNALGSLFLLVSPVALDWCLDSRTRGRGVAVLAVVLAGAWLAGSRIAIALLPIAAVGLLAWRRRPNRLRLAGAGLIAAVLMAVAILTPSIRHVGASTAWAVRRDMGVVTARMLSAAPVFGVGIGEFSRQSTPLMPASLRALYARENAHNQFFQTAGELGLVGAMALAAVLWLMAQSIARQWGRPGHLAGLSVGVLAFLVSWLGQHPLLESHVAAAFWIAAGVLRGHVVVATVRTGWLTRLAAGLVGGIVVSLPLQTALRASRVDLAGTFVKASLVRDEPGSPRYWAIERDGTVYLPGQAVACAFELRARGIPGEADVTLQLDHQDAGRLRVRRGEWRRAEILLPRASRWPVANHRVDFAWTPEAVGLASLDVTEPACRLPAGSTHR
jgi:hypothetical protein